ncbi:MAG: YggS family pyridoxal phosphate-dependent enzyme [Lachnospiraceae bacterium]|nr:YggS family pyridoxal phosphate-dependent enzyme [Lachnospiraceae bacterium]
MDKVQGTEEIELSGIEISANLHAVRNRIDLACKKSGRDPGEVTLIAVSKTKPLSMLQAAYDYGCRDFGENKVQELVDKMDKMPGDIRWHMIGHLQTNKVKYIVGRVYLIHSVDSLKLAKEISKESVKRNVISNILVEINIASESSKFGTTTKEATELVTEIAGLPNLCIRGFMSVAPYVVNPEGNRQYFAVLKQLYVDIMQKNIDNTNINILSMGMSGDFEVAVEEGATCVRVGTGIFGARNYSIQGQGEQ